MSGPPLPPPVPSPPLLMLLCSPRCRAMNDVVECPPHPHPGITPSISQWFTGMIESERGTPSNAPSRHPAIDRSTDCSRRRRGLPGWCALLCPPPTAPISFPLPHPPAQPILHDLSARKGPCYLAAAKPINTSDVIKQSQASVSSRRRHFKDFAWGGSF